MPDQPATLPIVAATTVIAGYTRANAMIMAGLNVVGEPSTVLFRRANLLGRAPAYFDFDRLEGRGIIDMATWSALLLEGDAVYVREALSRFRIHPEQRQHDPAKAPRTIASIRALQARWEGLGLHRRVPPNLLLTQPFPPGTDGDWTLARVESFAPPPMPLDA